MKRLLAYLFIVLGLLWSNISFAYGLRVVDGDTIVLNGEKIRFSGFDTLELMQICLHNVEIVNCGMFAKILLVKKIFSSMQTYVIATQGKTSTEFWRLCQPEMCMRP